MAPLQVCTNTSIIYYGSSADAMSAVEVTLASTYSQAMRFTSATCSASTTAAV
jgi:hypothetical protein